MRYELYPSRTLWHAACICLCLSGCLILRGPWGVRKNSPPEEFMISPRDRIVLDTELQSVLVGFRDEDGDPLFFTWVIDGRPADVTDVSTFVDPNDPLLFYSSYQARRSALLDVSSVSVLVTDTEAMVQVSWQVEVP